MLNTGDAIEVLSATSSRLDVRFWKLPRSSTGSIGAGAARSTPRFPYESSPTGAGSTDRGRPGPGRDHSAHLLAASSIEGGVKP